MISRVVRTGPWMIASAGYLALTCILLWPLPLHLSSVIPDGVGDNVLNTWILWWNAHTVPLTTRWWNAPIFWPATGALAFSEHLLGVSVLTSPMQWAGAGPLTTYNVALLLTFPLSAIAAHALVFDITKRHDAALVGGLVFGFNPYRVYHLGHLQMLWCFWMPLALLGLHLYLARNDRRWLWLFSVAWLLQALSNGYFLFFFGVLILAGSPSPAACGSRRRCRSFPFCSGTETCTRPSASGATPRKLPSIRPTSRLCSARRR